MKISMLPSPEDLLKFILLKFYFAWSMWNEEDLTKILLNMFYTGLRSGAYETM